MRTIIELPWDALAGFSDDATAYVRVRRHAPRLLDPVRLTIPTPDETARASVLTALAARGLRRLDAREIGARGPLFALAGTAATAILGLGVILGGAFIALDRRAQAKAAATTPVTVNVPAAGFSIAFPGSPSVTTHRDAKGSVDAIQCDAFDQSLKLIAEATLVADDPRADEQIRGDLAAKLLTLQDRGAVVLDASHAVGAFTARDIAIVATHAAGVVTRTHLRVFVARPWAYALTLHHEEGDAAAAFTGRALLGSFAPLGSSK
jgi:hypothetical protein